MGIVKDLQRDLVHSQKSTIELLRMAKVIAVKLSLDDITGWLERETNGYPRGTEVPPYRFFGGGNLQFLNPYHGWRPAGILSEKFPVRQPISQLESLSSAKTIALPLTRENNYQLTGDLGMDISDWQQQIVFTTVQLKGLLSAIRDKLLDWSLELEKRGIHGEDMSFNATEKKAAHNITFNIYGDGNAVGLGNRTRVKKK